MNRYGKKVLIGDSMKNKKSIIKILKVVTFAMMILAYMPVNAKTSEGIASIATKGVIEKAPGYKLYESGSELVLDAATKNVIDLINNLPDQAQLSDEPDISKARLAFDRLSGEQKELVGDEVYDKLKRLEMQVEYLKVENPVTKLSAIDSSIVLEKNTEKTIKVLVTKKDPARESFDKVEFLSSKEKIATVSDSKFSKEKLTFKVMGLKAGKSTITAKVGTQSITVKVTVLKKANKAKSIKTVQKQVTVKKGKKKVLTVTVTPTNKKYAITDIVNAASSKSKVAAVTKISTVKGKIKVTVKALKKGKSTLTVKAGKKKAKIKVNVQ